MKRLYEVVTSCEVAGRWRKSGDRVELTAAEAKYLAPPLGAILLPVDAEGQEGRGGWQGRQASAQAPARHLTTGSIRSSPSRRY